MSSLPGTLFGKRIRTATCALAFVVMSFPLTHERATAADELIREMDVLAPQPLPFQAISVRGTMYNPTDHTIVPHVGYESAFLLSELRAPDVARFVEIAGRTENGVGEDPPVAVRQFRLRKQRGSDPPFGPSEEGSVIRCWGECICDENGSPLFPTPGEYLARIKWHTKGRYIEREMVFSVGVPEGDDASVYEMLKANGPLALSMCSPVVVPKGPDVEALASIIARFPKSSYSDYARFALIRASVLGWNNRKSREFSEEKYRHALSLMSGVDLKVFPYASQLLSLMRKAASRFDPEKSAELSSRLDREFPEHRARLDDLAERLSQQEWDRLNPCSPKKRREANN